MEKTDKAASGVRWAKRTDRKKHNTEAKRVWDARREALGQYGFMVREGATSADIKEAEERLDVTFPTDVRAMVSEADGVGLPCIYGRETRNFKTNFEASKVLKPISQWEIYEDEGDDTFENDDPDVPRITIGVNPKMEEYGYYVFMRADNFMVTTLIENQGPDADVSYITLKEYIEKDRITEDLYVKCINNYLEDTLKKGAGDKEFEKELDKMVRGTEPERVDEWKETTRALAKWKKS